VEFEIEKNANSERSNFADCVWTGGGKQLNANFEQANQVGYRLCERNCGWEGIEIQGDDQVTAGMRVKGQGLG
jgi:hypothetical protein